jgi:hypothetical protein
MKLSELLGSSAVPALHVVETDESTLCDLSWAIAGQDSKPAVRTIRSRKCRTRAALFDEMGAALQFPYYFGENWDALDEVITDLSWHDEAAFLLLFSGAEVLLADAPKSDLALLVQALAGAHEYWQKDSVPFYAAFQCATREGIEVFGRRLEAAGATFGRLSAG